MKKAVVVITGKPVKMLKKFKEDPLGFLYHQEDLGEYKNTMCSHLIDEIQELPFGFSYENLSDKGKSIYDAFLSELEHLVAKDALEDDDDPSRIQADKILTQSARSVMFGLMIDVIEDWLEEKGVTPDDIPNEERERDGEYGDDCAAIIYGSDYDKLADCFSEIIGIRRYDEGLSERCPMVLTAGVLKELISGVNVPALKVLTEGKGNDDIINVFDETAYIATKLWSGEDVKGILAEMGYKPSDKNVAAVLATNELRKLADTVDEDWNIIRNAIKAAKDLEVNYETLQM